MWNVYNIKQTNNTTITTKEATAKSILFSFCEILRNKLIHVNVAINVCKSSAKDDFVEWYHIPAGFLIFEE